jgi:3-oxoacyl-[acyl-carrier-protein] synthase-1
MAHQVVLEESWRGVAKLARMAAMALKECLQGVPRAQWHEIPLLLCVAERERPGRPERLDELILGQVEEELDARFPRESFVIPAGRMSVAIALAEARKLIREHRARRVVVAATDGYLSWPTLAAYDRDHRLLTATNSDGFMPGEAAGAILVTAGEAFGGVMCKGIGFGREKSYITAELPLRADGLSIALKGALQEAGCAMHDTDWRITDLSGEQYYFKEAALALSRTLHQRKEELDLWHPAECIGETGAAAGAAMLCVALAACRKGYAPGPNIIAHMANDDGLRGATVLSFRAA